MTGFDCYRTYLAFKNHFTKDNFDYFKYGGKTNATTTSFNKRNSLTEVIHEEGFRLTKLETTFV